MPSDLTVLYGNVAFLIFYFNWKIDTREKGLRFSENLFRSHSGSTSKVLAEIILENQAINLPLCAIARIWKNIIADFILLLEWPWVSLINVTFQQKLQCDIELNHHIVQNIVMLTKHTTQICFWTSSITDIFVVLSSSHSPFFYHDPPIQSHFMSFN